MNEMKVEGFKDQPHSVKFSISQKGLLSAEVKCYGSSSQEALERATKLLKEVEILIKEKNN